MPLMLDRSAPLAARGQLVARDPFAAKRGAALIIAVIAIIVIGGTSAAFLFFQIEVHQSLQMRKARVSALNGAEAGAMAMWDRMIQLALKVDEYDVPFTIQDGTVVQPGDVLSDGQDGVAGTADDIVMPTFDWCDYSITMNQPAGTNNWVILATGRVNSPVGVDGIVERTVQINLEAEAAPGDGPFGFALHTQSDLTTSDPIFTDSFDSSDGPYTPAPASFPFTTDFQDEGGALSSEGNVSLFSAANELHGPVYYGAGFTGSAAGALSHTPEELPAPPTAIDVATIRNDALANNDNAEINGNATYDPLYYFPGFFLPYDEFFGTYALAALGNTTIRLGDPGGTPKTYFFSSVSAALGATIEILGPTTIVVDSGGITADGWDFTRNLVAGNVPATEVQIYLPGAQQLTLDLNSTFAAGVYAPQCGLIWTGGDQEMYGSMIVRELSSFIGGRLTLHYDEALAAIGGTPGGNVTGYGATGWIEVANP